VAHQVWLNYTLEDLERERAALRRLRFGGAATDPAWVEAPDF